MSALHSDGFIQEGLQSAMAVVSAPLSHVGGMVVAPPAIAEPAYRGLWSWFTTVDHKRIGILYGVSAGTFFVIGGLEALVIRLQLWRAEQHARHARRCSTRCSRCTPRP